jgi:adenine/guanine phosphoribosyltransferase-like PRPP-binding protein
MSTHEAASWLRDAVEKDGVARIVKVATKALKVVEFDTIAFRGMSGALIAPIVAHKMKKEVAMLRKSGAQTHSCYEYEGHTAVQRYVILDDFVSTGQTVAGIIRDMRRSVPGAKFVGLYTYYSTYDKSAGWYPVDQSELFDKIKRHMKGEEL